MEIIRKIWRLQTSNVISLENLHGEQKIILRPSQRNNEHSIPALRPISSKRHPNQSWQ